MSRCYKIKVPGPIDSFVVVFVCLFLMAIIPLLCHAARSDSFRMVCLKNLSVIGKAVQIYVNDYEDKYPRAGGPTARWARCIKDWKASNRFDAYGSNPDGSNGRGSITSCFYLLVKYTEVEPKTFICPSDTGTVAFNPANYDAGDRGLITLWDFGPNPSKHVSYAYQMVYGPYKLTASSDPNMAILADRNPWIDSPFQKAKDFSKFKPEIAPFNGTHEQMRCGNSPPHDNDGQNVLFMDGSMRFEDKSYCGVDNDNIYTYWDGDDKVRGKPAKFGSEPANELDSLLVNDPPIK